MADRLRSVARLRGIDPRQLAETVASGGLDPATADRMVENALGTLGLPFGVALNFRVNGRFYLVPMAVEEPSVIAGASHAAKRSLAGGGFRARTTEPRMIAQIHLDQVSDPEAAAARITGARDELLQAADRTMPGMVARGGGARDVSVRALGDGMLVVHVVVDCRDAMGANLLDTVAEALGDRVAELGRGRLGPRILSNYSDERRSVVELDVPVTAMGVQPDEGAAVAESIVRVARFAQADTYRAVTHNKGVMNGVDAVVVATGNDWRAVEAAAHAFASRSGRYAPLSSWELREHGATLHGRLEIPLAVGVVGGALRAHHGARLALQIAGVSSASELAELAACAGLATNLAALRALGTSGIQRCHMPLHRRASSRPEPNRGAA